MTKTKQVEQEPKLEWLDELHGISRFLQFSVSPDLAALSDNLRAVGNTYLADHLRHYSFAMAQCGERIHKATGTIVGEQVQRADQATANMMGAILTLVQTPKKKVPAKRP